MNKFIIPSIVFYFCICTCFADIKLPGIIADNMILQRNMSNKIWGWADSGEKITIVINNQSYKTTSDASGKWLIKLNPSEAGGPFTMQVSGKNSIIINNILFGDVWICSGQSNMEWKMKWLGDTYKIEIETANNPNIRLVDIANEYDVQVREDAKINKTWSQVNSENLPEFSAIAYFFAKNLYEKYKVPIGLISSEWGGTVAEAWMSYEGLSEFPNYISAINKLKTYNNDEIKKQAQEKYTVWKNTIVEKDKLSKDWIKPTYNTNDWKKLNLPGLWESQGLNIDGIVYFKREFSLSPSEIKNTIILTIPGIDDIDTTFINGVQVGTTTGYDKERKYIIDPKILKSGSNTIIIKAWDTGGGGGIYGDEKKFIINTNSKIIPLAGEWKYKISVSDKDVPPNPTVSTGFPNQPTVLYNSMIYPIINYGIKGAIWYQGESNAGKAYEYRKLFADLIKDWRKSWNIGDFPFLYVQLANFKKAVNQPAESDWAELREAQNMALNLSNTGQAVIIDIGDPDNIHPKNKADVGKRLALNAMKVAYSDNKIIFSGPTYKSLNIVGNSIKLSFDNVGSGLEVKGNELKYFEIAGSDKKFVWAQAKIENNEIIVWNDKIKNPVAVRYAWADNPEGCNLYNKDGLPASPFRTDNWDGITKGK